MAVAVVYTEAQLAEIDAATKAYIAKHYPNGLPNGTGGIRVIPAHLLPPLRPEWRKAETLREVFEHAAGRVIARDERTERYGDPDVAVDTVYFTDGTAIRSYAEYEGPYSDETGGASTYMVWEILK